MTIKMSTAVLNLIQFNNKPGKYLKSKEKLKYESNLMKKQT